MIYKTILTFWWQNNGTLEFRSQCHIFGWYIDIILTRCFRTIAIHLRNFLKTLEGDFKIQKENKKLYLGDSQMVNFLTRKPPVNYHQCDTNLKTCEMGNIENVERRTKNE